MQVSGNQEDRKATCGPVQHVRAGDLYHVSSININFDSLSLNLIMRQHDGHDHAVDLDRAKESHVYFIQTPDEFKEEVN